MLLSELGCCVLYCAFLCVFGCYMFDRHFWCSSLLVSLASEIAYYVSHRTLRSSLLQIFVVLSKKSGGSRHIHASVIHYFVAYMLL